MLRQSYLPIFDLINLNLYLTLKQNKMKKIMKHKFQYMLLLLLAIPCHSFAGEKSHVADSENLLLNKSLQQSVTIKGNVTDAAGEPLIGVSVLVKVRLMEPSRILMEISHCRLRKVTYWKYPISVMLRNPLR